MKKKHEEVKNELLSTYHVTPLFHTRTSISADLKYLIIFLISLEFNEMQHLKVG